MVPIKGAPIREAQPLQKQTIPKTEVNFSIPNVSQAYSWYRVGKGAKKKPMSEVTKANCQSVVQKGTRPNATVNMIRRTLYMFKMLSHRREAIAPHDSRPIALATPRMVMTMADSCGLRPGECTRKKILNVIQYIKYYTV